MKFFPAYSSCLLALSTFVVTCCMDAQPGFSRSEARNFLHTAVAVIFITTAATASSLLPLGSLSTSLAIVALVFLVLMLTAATCLPDIQEERPNQGQESEPMHIIIQRAVLTWEYWVYIGVFCTCAGSGQMILTNLYQIADASGYAERSEALLCLETWEPGLTVFCKRPCFVWPDDPARPEPPIEASKPKLTCAQDPCCQNVRCCACRRPQHAR